MEDAANIRSVAVLGWVTAGLDISYTTCNFFRTSFLLDGHCRGENLSEKVFSVQNIRVNLSSTRTEPKANGSAK